MTGAGWAGDDCRFGNGSVGLCDDCDGSVVFFFEKPMEKPMEKSLVNRLSPFQPLK